MRLLIMGPPGAGKGTQAVALSERLHIAHVSTGDIFRANAADRTPLGIRAQQFMDAGEYVPDDITNDMVRDRLAQPDVVGGFVLDGYPRTTSQVAELDDMLASRDLSLDRVVELTVDTEQVVQRLLARAQAQGRRDDTEDVIRRRLEVYFHQTAPLTSRYAERGLLVRVDGLGGIDEVTERVLKALES
jgi:adenylate kinase